MVQTKKSNPIGVQIVNQANASGNISSAGLAHIISTDERSFWSMFVQNNPAGVNNYLMNTLGYKTLGAHPQLKAIMGQMKLIIQKAETTNDYSILLSMLGKVPFGVKTQNWTTNQQLWSQLGVPYGDFLTLFMKYYSAGHRLGHSSFDKVICDANYTHCQLNPNYKPGGNA
jgi:hypothetical protein